VCGINLFIDKKNNSDENIIRKMNAATHHRGPDASRFGKYQFSGNTIFIGNNRLKIIDTSDEANQPFISSDGRYCLSFNGEIYNYKELRQTLNNKYTFRTGSDSEVLLYQLIEYGTRGLTDMNGMFAFVLYDSQTGSILIARDRHGIKPVYYSANENFLLISSEIKGLLASGLINKEFNSDQIPHYLNYKYAQRPATFYKKIYELEPGHLIEATTDSFLIKKWHIDNPIQQPEKSSSLIPDIKELLLKSVEKQLQSDVSNGIFLSGGVDSTLLLAIAQELGVKKLPSFSVINSAEDRHFGTDDYLYAQKAANLYNSEHHEISISSEILKQAEELFQQIDQPIGDSALLLTWLLSEKASSKVRMALSGAGADEWFAGYNRHWAYKKYLEYFYENNSLIKISNLLTNIVPDGFSHPLRRQARLWNKFASEISSDPIKTFNKFRSQNFSSEFISSVEKKSSEQFFTKEKLLQNALSKDRNEYLISDVLMLTDKMSMLKGLEVRVPYLDNNLTDYLSSLPAELLLKNGRKWILKELLQKMGGKEFTSRSKEGFGMPVGKWIKEKKNNFMLEHIRNKKSYIYNYIPYEAVTTMLNKHLSGKADYSSPLWSLIVLTNWLQKEFAK
jgi:asparagine synthase (glutamine-hydrolysing)